MKKDYTYLAKEILLNVGGKENISVLTHCSTRLRFTLKDNSKANTPEIEKLEGVLKVLNNAQYQVVIGSDVSYVYDELLKLGINTSGNVENEKTINNKKPGEVVLDYLVSIFQPLIPYLIGSGMIKALLAIAVLCGVDKTGSTYLVISSIADAAYYFLPLAVAVTTAERVKCNKLMAIACVSALLIPSLTTQLAEGATLFGITLKNISYAYQVFPAILCVFMYAFMEKITKKYIPKILQQLLVPVISLAVTLPITLFLLGPLGFEVGTLLKTVILFLYAKVGWLAVGLLAGALPIMVGTGMHKALVPYAVSTFGELGYEMFYLPASLAHNLGECGTCLAVALRTKDKKLKESAIECLVAALTAVTEPTLYTITLVNKRALAGTMIGSFVSGCIIGMFQLKCFVVAGPTLLNIPMWIDPNNPMNFKLAMLGLVIAILSSFIAVFILYKDPEQEREDRI